MKKIKIILLIGVISLVISVISSCKKDNPVTIQRTEPSISSLFMRFLRHNATDSIATLPHGISVHLYFSSSDQLNHTNQIGATLSPDNFGQISLPAPVQKRTYYWWAEMGANCEENYGSVDASINITHSTYAELTSSDALVIFNRDTCTGCAAFTVYMMPASDALAANLVKVANMKQLDTTRIPNLEIGVNNVRIERDSTRSQGKAGLLKDTTLTSLNDFTNYGLVFTATQQFTLHSIDIYNGPKQDTIILEVQDNTGTALTGLSGTHNPDTVILNTTKGANTVILDWNIPVLTDMRLVRIAGGSSADSISFTPSGLISSLPINIDSTSHGNITHGYYNGTNNDYNLAYNWNITVYHPPIDTTFTVIIYCDSTAQQTFYH